MTRTIDFYFDFPSPYAYLAHTQLPGIAAKHDATIAYHPFRILELMKIVGNRPTTIECENKRRYAGADLARWTKRYKVDFARNPHSKSFDFPALERGALVAIEDGRGAAYVTAIFAASARMPRAYTQSWMPKRKQQPNAVCSARLPFSSATRCSSAMIALTLSPKPSVPQLEE